MPFSRKTAVELAPKKPAAAVRQPVNLLNCMAFVPDTFKRRLKKEKRENQRKGLACGQKGGRMG